MFRMLLGYISPLGIFTRIYVSWLPVFVFTDEGDCMVTETFGCIQVDRLVYQEL